MSYTKGYRVDYCLHWAKACGKPAADMFCQLQKFKSAVHWKVAHDVGHKTPTIVIGDGRLCRHQTCDALSMVKCEK